MKSQRQRFHPGGGTLLAAGLDPVSGSSACISCRCCMGMGHCEKVSSCIPAVIFIALGFKAQSGITATSCLRISHGEQENFILRRKLRLAGVSRYEMCGSRQFQLELDAILPVQSPFMFNLKKEIR
jgi:hypothetical protein